MASGRIAGAALLLAVLAPAGATAAEDGCERFDEPVAALRSVMAEPKSAVPSGSVQATGEVAFTLALRPLENAGLPVPPERRGRPGGAHAGFVSVAVPAGARRLEVAASAPAWIDLVQDGRYRRSVSHSGAHGCPDLRKIVRFDLEGGGPVVVQVSGVSADAIVLVVRPD